MGHIRSLVVSRFINSLAMSGVIMSVVESQWCHKVTGCECEIYQLIIILMHNYKDTR